MRFLLVLALGLFVAACSTSERSGTDASSTGSTGTTTGQTMTGPEPGTQAHLNQTIGDRVFFDFDRYSIRSDMQGTVSAWAQWMKENPGVSILVEGHADERGTRDYNYALGARRSHEVKLALTAMGVDGDRIETTTFGKDRPAVLGSNEAAWAKNRRAVVVVASQGPSA
ncbi:peptidoglycan-associated lipoprotein Pal [Marinobacter sp.]|uniref:peptidoglycan-associated lipoprotein Pal n=1 Tax=Marinobacter sp. TaxID=50741 RepID=UPI0035682A4E